MNVRADRLVDLQIVADRLKANAHAQHQGIHHPVQVIAQPAVAAKLCEPTVTGYDPTSKLKGIRFRFLDAVDLLFTTGRRLRVYNKLDGLKAELEPVQRCRTSAVVGVCRFDGGTNHDVVQDA